MVYRKLPDKLPNPGPFIGELRKCRDAVIRASATVKSFGVTYHALQMILTAIDGAAHVITGEPYYFHETGSSSSEGQLQASARQRAFERGEGEL